MSYSGTGATGATTGGAMTGSGNTTATAAAATGGAGGAGGQTGGAPGAAGAAGIDPDILNYIASFQLLAVYVGAVVVFAVYNVIAKGARYIRRMATLTSDRQGYFAEPNAVAGLKRNLIYAPLFKQRQNRELALGKIRLGVVPGRLPTLLLLGVLGVNIYLLVRDLTIPVTAQNINGLYKRAATLATTNLIPLFFMAQRTNPFIMVTGVGFNDFNTLHRWFGRLVISLIIIHGTSEIINVVSKGGTQAIKGFLLSGNYVTQGYIAALCLVAIGFQSAPYLRKPFYETFLIGHQALVAVFLAFAVRHTSRFWQNGLVSLAITLWVADRVMRLINVVKNNLGKRRTKILAEVLPGQALRLTVYAARPWKVIPGQHVFLYMPSVSLWQSHPFSIAWSEKEQSYKEPDSYEVEKGGLIVSGSAVSTETSFNLIVRKRGGATSTLYNKAVKAGGRWSSSAFVEGPYGALHGLDSYGTVLLFSGGVGITHHVPYIRRLVEGFTTGTVSCRKLVMVWAVQSAEHLEWVRPWMTTILGMEGRRDLLRIMIFVTRPDPNNPQALDVQSPSASVKMFPGRRPDIASIIDAEAADQVGTMAISVCGSGAFSDAVRLEARKRTKTSNVDLLDESFSW